MFCLHFEIRGEPVAKGRPKICARGGFARAYTPKKTKHGRNTLKYTTPAQKQGGKSIPVVYQIKSKKDERKFNFIAFIGYTTTQEKVNQLIATHILNHLNVAIPDGELKKMEKSEDVLIVGIEAKKELGFNIYVAILFSEWKNNQSEGVGG